MKGLLQMLAGVAAALLVVAFLTGSFDATPSAPDGSRSIVTATGAGIMDSAPMQMSGTYEVTWKATGTANGCYHAAGLRTTADKRAADLVALMVTGKQTGTVWVYNLPAGSYFVNANSGCNPWSFSFSPR